MTISPNLGLDLPDVGGPGIDYAQRINATLLERVDPVIAVSLAKYDPPLDGIADGSDEVQAAIDDHADARGGVRLLLPSQGAIRTANRLVIKAENTVIVGSGHRNCQDPLTTHDETVKSTIYSNHDDVAIDLSHINDINGFRLENMTLAGNPSNRGAAALGFDLGGAGEFRRDFMVLFSTICGFEVAALLYESAASSGSSESMGVLRVLYSNVMHNLWIAKTDDGTQWNGFTFEHNEAGQNGSGVGEGGIDVAAHAASICKNILEGQRDAVRVSGAYGAISVKGNYFEANSGDYCIELEECRGPFDVGPNVYLGSMPDRRVVINATGAGQMNDIYWPELAYRLPFPAVGEHTEFRQPNNHNVDFVFVDRMKPEYLATPPRLVVAPTRLTTFTDAATGPIDPARRVPSRLRTMSGSGLLALTTPLVASADQWVVGNFLIRRHDVAATSPYLSMRINDVGAPTGGSRDADLANFTRYLQTGEWVLVTMAVLATVAVTEVVAYIYPYGINPTAGLVADVINPEFYVVGAANDIRPHISERGLVSVTAAPAAGTWAVGDEVFRTPQAAGQAHKWVCTAAGTPGTWTALTLS